MGNATSLIHHCITIPCCSGSKLLTLGAVLVGGFEVVVLVPVAELVDELAAEVLGLPVPVALVPALPAPLSIEVFT